MAEKTPKPEMTRPEPHPAPEPEKVLPAGIEGVKGIAEKAPEQVRIHPPGAN